MINNFFTIFHPNGGSVPKEFIFIKRPAQVKAITKISRTSFNFDDILII